MDDTRCLFFGALRRGDLNETANLLATGKIDVDEEFRVGGELLKPLHIAVDAGIPEMCTLLLDAKCAVDPWDSQFFTPLRRMFNRRESPVTRADARILEILLRAGASTEWFSEQEGKLPAVFVLLRDRKLGLLKQFLEIAPKIRSSLVDVRNNDGFGGSPLFLLTYFHEGQDSKLITTVAERLIELGADTVAPSIRHNRYTALDFAVEQKAVAVARALLSHHTGIMLAKNLFRNTRCSSIVGYYCGYRQILQYSTRNRPSFDALPLVELLLSYGASPRPPRLPEHMCSCFDSPFCRLRGANAKIPESLQSLAFRKLEERPTEELQQLLPVGILKKLGPARFEN